MTLCVCVCQRMRVCGRGMQGGDQVTDRVLHKVRLIKLTSANFVGGYASQCPQLRVRFEGMCTAHIRTNTHRER